MLRCIMRDLEPAWGKAVVMLNPFGAVTGAMHLGDLRGPVEAESSLRGPFVGVFTTPPVGGLK